MLPAMSAFDLRRLVAASAAPWGVPVPVPATATWPDPAAFFAMAAAHVAPAAPPTPLRATFATVPEAVSADSASSTYSTSCHCRACSSRVQRRERLHVHPKSAFSLGRRAAKAYRSTPSGHVPSTQSDAEGSTSESSHRGTYEPVSKEKLEVRESRRCRASLRLTRSRVVAQEYRALIESNPDASECPICHKAFTQRSNLIQHEVRCCS
jgi:hypothetical protein